MVNAVLQHHGILGQKWGVRRYQNKDGSLTPAGKKHVASNKEENKKTQSAKRTIKDLSDDELNTMIKRLELEKKYKSLLTDEKSKKTSEAGKKFILDLLEKSAKNIGGQLTTYALGTAVNKAFGENIVNPKKGQKDK